MHSSSERPEYVRQVLRSDQFGIVEAPLSAWERIYNIGAVRKTFILVVLVIVWEVYADFLNSPLLLPTFSATVEALFGGIYSGVLIDRAWVSIQLLLTGYAAGLFLAAVMTFIAITTRLGTDFLETLTAMFNPLPSIALLPLALIWFGLGPGSLVFVLIHAVLWAVALNTLSGFRSVSKTMEMVGRNYGLGSVRLVLKVLIPAAFPSILAGLKIGWAFAWRTLIASELVFGVTSGAGGLGWYIYQNKNQLEIANVFAGLLMIILIGLVVENLIFRTIENKTIQRWGMQT